MNLSDWFVRDAIVERLVAAEMVPLCAELAAERFAQAAATLAAAGLAADREVVACWIPGRIEVLGKHTDYCGGRSLTAAAERGFCMLGARRDDRLVRMIDAERGESVVVPIEDSPARHMGHWSNYPQTVVRRLDRNFPGALVGASIAFASNLPASAGMSSSSALIVGTFTLLAEIGNLNRQELFREYITSRVALAAYLGTVENGSSFGPLQGDLGVGTFGGSEDHTAILCGRPNNLTLYSFGPLCFERSVPIDPRYTFAVASSGVVAEKTGAALEKYNRVAQLASAIVDLWHEALGRSETTLGAILASGDEAADRLRGVLQNATQAPYPHEELMNRLKQFEIESHLIDSLPPAIDATTIDRFRTLAQRSQDAAERLLRNQVPETIALARNAERLGAHAATSFGAGFGGSVWALVDTTSAARFLREWKEAYSIEFPQAATRTEFLSMRPGRPATTWNGSLFHDVPPKL